MSGKIKWIIGILGLSLALNVFALGLFIGKGAQQIVPNKDRVAPPPPMDFNFRRLERNLSDEDRDKVRALLREKQADLRRGFRALRRAEREIKDIVLADTVDKEALKEALKKHSELGKDMIEPMRWVVLETISELDLETRKRVVEDMFKRPKRGRPRDGRPPHRPPPGHHPPPRDGADM